MTKPSPCPSEFALERWRFGELVASADEARIVAHVADCSACRLRQAELVSTEQPALELQAIWTRATDGERRRQWRPGVWRGAAVAAAALSAVLLFWLRPQPDILTKGSWQLGVIARSRDGIVTRVDPGASLLPGDRLRFEVMTDWPQAEIALVLLDGTGKVSRLAPSQQRSLSIAGGKRVLVDDAVELDGTLGSERIVLVGCPGALDAAQVMVSAERALSAASGDPRQVTSLGTGCHEESFWISKVAP